MLLEGRQPLILVEAKSRDIPPDLERVVEAQLRLFAEETGSTWLVLLEPRRTRVFRRNGAVESVAAFPTDEVMEVAGIAPPAIVGERTLLLAAERWIRALPAAAKFVSNHPEIAPFVDAARRVTDSEWNPAIE